MLQSNDFLFFKTGSQAYSYFMVIAYNLKTKIFVK